MPKKIILTTEQHNMLINHITSEMVNSNIVITENWWENVKYNLSKLGRYKVGDKLTGRGKIDSEVNTIMKGILNPANEKGYELIRNFDDSIKDTGFPNNNSGNDFLGIVLELSAIYDSIVAATQKPYEDKDYIPAEAANILINDLRLYIKKFLDIDLKGVYSVVDEVGNPEQISQPIELDPWNTGKSKTRPEPEPEIDRNDEPEVDYNETPNSYSDNEYYPKHNAKDIRNQLKGKQNNPKDFNSTKMNNLNSPKATLGLGGLGIALGGILSPIGIALMTGGALVSFMRKKGQTQSRAATLNALYQSIRNIPVLVKQSTQQPTQEPVQQPTQEPVQQLIPPRIKKPKLSKPVVPQPVKQNVSRETNDELYDSLSKLFRFIISSYKKIGNIEKMKVGDNYTYNGKPVKIINPSISNGKTQIQYLNKTKNKFAVDTNQLKRLNESILSEGRYIKDYQLINYLYKELSIDRVDMFEKFISKIEMARNKLKNIKYRRVTNNNDKIFNEFIKKFKQNPIIITDFKQMFNVSATNPKAYENLKNFIDNIFSTIYSGKFKKELTGIIDRISLSEAETLSVFQQDSQDRRKFKRNLIIFLNDAITFFEFLSKERNNSKKSQI